MKTYLSLAFGLFVIAVAGPIAAGSSPQSGPALRTAGQQAGPAPRQAGPAVQQAGAAPQQQNANVPAGNAANGRKLFVSFGCYQCHGYEAQGGSAGPRLAPRPIAYAQFMKYVRHPTNEMPPFTEKTVKDAELTDIYAFLRGQPAPPDLDKIPLLK
ncbi:MAG TPA: cytochrome c [Vicinamibacterales bacterium]|jgi:mono/diheme cytochrome c family protein